jgi:transposase
LGRSRGGFSTKINLICDRNGLPITVEIAPGQAHESPRLIPLVDTICVRSSGAPKRRPRKLAGDKGCSSEKNRTGLKARKIIPVIAHRDNESGRQEETFDREAYRERNIIERLIGWMKELRRIATRYEKLASHYLGMLKLGMIRQYLKTE